MARKSVLEQFHKENITAVADRLFSENGLEKTTMDDIAREADYSKATLYAYFKGKDEIFNYIVLKGMKILHEQLEKVVAEHTDAYDAYFAMCGALSEYCSQYPLYFQSILETIASDSISRRQSPVLEEIYQVGEILNQDVGKLVEKGIAQGVFREDTSSVSTVFVLWSALSGIISLADKKQDYINQRMGISRTEFMRFGFEMMLRSVTKPDSTSKTSGTEI